MVSEYITGVKVAYEVAKALKLAAESIDDAQIKFQIAELISALADAKIQAAESAEIISELERKLKSKKQMIFENGKYFRLNENEEREGPFCATCYDADGKEIRLQHTPRNQFHDWECYVCEGSFN